MLYVIGLGLSDERDITVKGLDAVKSCERIYLEAYTSILMVEKEKLEAFYGKPVTIADREMVESDSDTILDNAQNVNVAFLVVGDPFGATTHTDLVIRAKELNIPLYNFGQTISMVWFTETWRPDSWYPRVKENRDIGLHTLVLLDIKVKEQSLENMARGRLIYEPPRFMTVNCCVEQMLEIEENRGENAYGPETLAIGCVRLGTPTQLFISGTMAQLLDEDFGEPLHSLVIIGKRMHVMEAEMVRSFCPEKYQAKFDEIYKRDYE
ncbi:diphthine synthase [Podila clonocystis]|nr:diphthine synthase [Podila clonocystis]